MGCYVAIHHWMHVRNYFTQSTYRN